MSQPTQPSGMTKGQLEGAPCPWCGKPQDFRDLDYGMEVGAQIQCESCHRHYEIARIKPITIVWLRRFQGRPGFPGSG
jgi:hypothetical protein